MATFTDTIKLVFDTSTKKASADLKALGSDFKDADGAAGKAKAGFAGVGNVLKDALGGGGMAAGLGMAALGTSVVALGSKVIGSFQDQAQAVLKFHQVSGLVEEDASRWVAVADDYEVSADDLSTAFGKMAKTLGTNADALDKYGVQVQHNKDGSVDMESTMLAVIDVMNKTTDETQRAALGNAAFGKGWQGMVKLVGAGADQLKSDLDSVKDYQLFDKASLDKSEDFRLAMDDLSDSVAGLERELGEGLVPVVADAAASLTDLVEVANDLTGPLGGISGWIGTIEDVAATPLRAIKGIAQGWNDLRIGDVGKAFEDVSRPAKELAADLPVIGGWFKDAPAITDETAQAYGAFAAGLGDAAGGANTLAAAQDDLRQKEEDATKAVEDQAKALDAANKAEQGYSDAVFASVDSQFALTKAAKDFKKVSHSKDIEESTTAAMKLAEAQVRLAKDTAATTGETLNATDQNNLLISSLEASAATMTGKNKQAIQEVIDKLKAVPTLVPATIDVTAETTKAANDTAAFIGAMESNPIDLMVRTSLDAAAAAKVTAEITALFVKAGKAVAAGGVLGGPSGYADGGYIPGGSVGLVGEAGQPELVKGPATVIGGDQTARILGGGSTVINNYITQNLPPGIDPRAVAAAARRYSRLNGVPA